MLRTYRGSCHCGAVHFECELDLAPEGSRSKPELDGVWWTSSFRCNCSWCAKTRFWKAFARPAGFRIVSGADVLTEYRFGERAIRHTFCSRCGVHPFATASFEPMGGDFAAINIACLDDVTPEELALVPITYEDGRNDAWDRPPAQTSYM